MPVRRWPVAGRRRRATRRPVLRAAGVAASLAVASVAVAVWTGDGRGTGAVRTAALDLAGARPVVQASGQDVSVSWKQSRLAGRQLGSQETGGYLVRRYDASGRQQQVRTACAGKVSGPGRDLRCVERGVAEGIWRYAVTPVLGGWTGTEGPRSTVSILAAATVTVTTPKDGGATRDPRPAITGTLSSEAGDATHVAVALAKGRDLDAIAHRLTATVRDGTWSVRPAVPLAEGVYTVRAGWADPKGYTTWSAASRFQADTRAPSTGDDTRQLGEEWQRTTQTVTLSPDDLGGSGVTATYFTTDGSNPTIGSRPGTRITVRAEGEHPVRYFSVDRAGNAEAVRTAASSIRIDRTAPAAVELDPLPGTIVDGQELTGSAGDALSGIAELGFEYCPEAACDTWTAIESGGAWHRQPADGTYRVRVRAVDKAGNAGVSDSQVVRVDNTPPTVTEVAGSDGDGKVEAGDTLVVTFSEPLDPASVPSSGRLTFNRPKEGDTTLHLPGVTAESVGTGAAAWVRLGRSVAYGGTIALDDGDRRLRFTVTACATGCRRASTGTEGLLRFVPAGSLHDPVGHAAVGSASATLTLF